MEDDEAMGAGRSPAPPVVEGCIEVCLRCLAVINVLRGAGGELAAGATAALGPQLRHCVEHFRCLVQANDDEAVDYDARPRDARLERDMGCLADAFAEVVQRLERIPAKLLRHPRSVLQQAASGAAVTPVASTLERELLFLSSHTIHHLAIIGQLASTCGLTLDDDLGVAFSTARHRKDIAVKERRG